MLFYNIGTENGITQNMGLYNWVDINHLFYPATYILEKRFFFRNVKLSDRKSYL